MQVERQYTFTLDRVPDLSPDRNVLLFVIDTYQSDLFAEILTRTPEWRSRLAGFTYFPDATSAFPKTYASIPDILTGKAFDNTQPFPEYQRDAYSGNSLPKVLKERGFDARYGSFTWRPYFRDPTVADNLSGVGSRADREWMQRLEFEKLINLTIFRASPFLAKPWAFNNNKFRIRNKSLGRGSGREPYRLRADQRRFSAGNDVHDLEFHDTMMAYLSAASDRPAFRVFHFRGVHMPLSVDRKLNYTGPRPVTREAVLEQAEGMLEMMALEFDRLREIGAFDNSTIFVIGDHGAGEYQEIGVHAQLANDLGLGVQLSTAHSPIDSRVIQGGIPLILVKRANEQGDLKISPAPVELGDIPNTVFDELGYDDVVDGPSMFEISPGQERIRTHRFYEFSGWGQDYIVPLTEYRVSGFSWDAGSWSRSDNDLNRFAVNSVDGTLVVLGEEGNLDDFEHGGWSPPTMQGRRLDGGSASIRIPVEANAVARALEIRVNPGHSPVRPVPMKVLVNEEFTAVFSVSRRSLATLSTRIPPRVYENSEWLDIRLELASPDVTGPLLTDIRLTSAKQARRYVIGEPLRIMTGGNAQPYLGQGWWDEEPWGTWTRDYTAVLSLRLAGSAGKNLEIEARLRPALFADSPPVIAELIVNGRPLAKWTLPGREWETRIVQIPPGLLDESGVLDLVFSIQNPRSPRDYGESMDPRKLGLGISGVVIRESSPGGQGLDTQDP